MCFLVGSRRRSLKGGHFKGVLTEMHRNNGQGLLKTEISLLLKKLHAWGVTTHHDLAS